MQNITGRDNKGRFYKGMTPANKSHGMTNHPMYKIYSKMKGRILCSTNPAFKDYGGRGLGIDPNWLGKDGFINFYKDMGERPDGMTLERVDNNKGYFKDNLIWASMREQSRNRRSNHFLTYNGETHHITDWADIVGIKRTTLMQRINVYGWSVERALTTKPLYK